MQILYFVGRSVANAGAAAALSSQITEVLTELAPLIVTEEPIPLAEGDMGGVFEIHRRNMKDLLT